MSLSRYIRRTILVSCFVVSASFAFAQVVVSNADWTSVINFKYCSEGECEIFRKVKLSVDSIEVGQNISVISLLTETEVAQFKVKSIKYGRQVKMCWIGDREGLSETYITVSGCER